MQRRTGGPFSCLLASRSPVPADHCRYPARPSTMRRPTLFAIAVVACIAVCLVVTSYFQPTRARAPLPATATGIMEYNAGPSGITGDVWYQLKARISPQEFEQFVLDMKLAPCPPGQDPKFGAHSGSEKWWDASSDGGVFIRVHSASSLERAKYENGYLYYIDSIGY